MPTTHALVYLFCVGADVPQDPALGVHLQGHDGEAVLPQHLHRGRVARPHALQPARPPVQRDRAVSALPRPRPQPRFSAHWTQSEVASKSRIINTAFHVRSLTWPFPLPRKERPDLFIFRKTSLNAILKWTNLNVSFPCLHTLWNIYYSKWHLISDNWKLSFPYSFKFASYIWDFIIHSLTSTLRF